MCLSLQDDAVSGMRVLLSDGVRSVRKARDGYCQMVSDQLGRLEMVTVRWFQIS